MHTVIFDIDGTLCDTNGVDEECFVRACEATFGPLPQPVNWESAPHVTDSSIADWWCRHALGRNPEDHEVELATRRFLAGLKLSLGTTPERFRPIPGAPELLRALSAKKWLIGMATGGWRASAQLKLQAAGLPSELLFASANDSPDRVAIFRLAAQRLGAGTEGLADRTVLVGDARWDMAVAATLGWGFLGVADGERATRLRTLGASQIVPDFTSLDEVCAALTAA